MDVPQISELEHRRITNLLKTPKVNIFNENNEKYEKGGKLHYD